MPEYPTPGVYVEKIEIGPKPIEGISTSTAAFVGKTERGPTKPRLITSFANYERVYGGYLEDSYLTYAIDGFFRNGGKRCYVGRIIDEDDAKRALLNPPLMGPNVDGNSQNKIEVKAVGHGVWGNRVYLKVEDASLTDRTPDLFKLTLVYFSEKPPHVCEGATNFPNGYPVDPTNPANRTDEGRREPSLVKVHDNLSPDPKLSNYYMKVVNGVSNLVILRAVNLGRPDNTQDNCGGTRKMQSVLLPLTSGKDGKEIDKGDYEGRQTTNENGEVERSGLMGFEQVDEISILCAPDENAVKDLRGALIDHCEKLKDRFAILQADYTYAAEIQELRPDRESKYAALYFPWIKVFDPLTNGQKLIPPGGHIAGIYARIDAERGVHKAPANELVQGAFQLQVQISKEQQGILNSRGVNVIRAFPGRGPLVWGARTISTDPLWKYVNVRRLFLFIEESIEEATRWVVFEPNSERLWPRVVASITQFLTRVWRDGALMGTTPEEAFFVKCDRSTMTQDDIDNGRLIVLIGVAPVKPTEFVVFRIAQTRAGAEVTEI